MLVAPRRGIVGRAAVRLRAGLRLAVLRSVAPGLVVLGTVILAPGAPATAGAPVSMTEQERAATLVAPSVVHLEVHWEGWVRDPATQKRWDDRVLTVTTRCSGVTVSNDGYIITASHCVDSGAEAVTTAFVEALVQRQVDEGALPEDKAESRTQEILASGVLEGPREGEPLNRTVFVQRSPATPGLTTGEATEARVVVSHRDAGISLVKIDRSNQPSARLGSLPGPGSVLDAVVLGYPTGADAANSQDSEPLDVTVRPASVMSLPPAPTPTPTAPPADGESPLVTVTADDLDTVMAGGPVVNPAGEVIGVVTLRSAPGLPDAMIVADPGALAMDFDANDVSNEPGEIDENYQAGLDAFLAGHYDDAIENLDDVLAALPSHQQAQDLRQQAVTLRKQERESAPPAEPVDRRPWYVGGGVALLVALGAAWYFREPILRRLGSSGSGSSSSPGSTDSRSPR